MSLDAAAEPAVLCTLTHVSHAQGKETVHGAPPSVRARREQSVLISHPKLLYTNGAFVSISSAFCPSLALNARHLSWSKERVRWSGLHRTHRKKIIQHVNHDFMKVTHNAKIQSML